MEPYHVVIKKTKAGKNPAYIKCSEGLMHWRATTYLECTKKYSAKSEKTPVRHKPHAQLDASPGDGAECEPIAHAEVAEEDVTRQLTTVVMSVKIDESRKESIYKRT